MVGGHLHHVGGASGAHPAHHPGEPEHPRGVPVEVVDIVIPAPGPNDVVVKVQATGVCHTDLAYRDGDIEDAFAKMKRGDVLRSVVEF